MVKIIKSYKLGTAQDAQVTAKPSKGTVSTPFTQQEYNQLTQAGEWTGGYVKGEGYLAMSTEIDSYSSFYLWPTIPDWLFIEMCKHFLNKNAIFKDICNVFNLSQIVEEYFHRYWYAEGNKTLSQDEFNAIISAIGNSSPTSQKSVTIDNKEYVCKQYNLSGNSTYKYVFGSTCYVFYYNNTPVGFKDDYDFNPLADWTVRGWEGELYTRAMNILGSFYGAADYSIYYGIHD